VRAVLALPRTRRWWLPDNWRDAHVEKYAADAVGSGGNVHRVGEVTDDGVGAKGMQRVSAGVVAVDHGPNCLSMSQQPLHDEAADPSHPATGPGD
jgi:hypothetical protein